MTAVMGFCALAVDYGFMVADANRLQRACDAAALAGASKLKRTGDDAADTQAAKDMAVLVAAQNQVTVDPSRITFLGDNSKIRVPATFQQDYFFARILGFTSGTVTRYAISRASRSRQSGNSDIGVLVLNPTASGALTLSGSSGMTVNGKVIVNSSSSEAAKSSGSAGLTSTTMDITGSYSSSSTSYFRATPLLTGVPPTPDFLAGVPVPDPSTMVVRSTSTYSVKAGETIQPGVYIGGISISSKPGVTFAPGIYYLQGGGFTMSGGSSTLTALNVMIYNGADSSGNTGKITVSGGGTVTMTPPSSGTYQGMAVFQDRSSTQVVTLSGGSGWDFSGTVYARSAKMVISGGSGGKMGSQYVSDTLTLSGSSTFQNIDPGSGSYGTDSTGGIYLIE